MAPPAPNEQPETASTPASAEGKTPRERAEPGRPAHAAPPGPWTDWIELTGAGLDAGAAAAFVSDARAGGIALFAGTTRAETRAADRRELVALDYEAYADMAEKQMRDLAARARQRWPILKLALLHRTGRVALAEPSVVIAVSTPHRGEAFDGCRFLIDALKREVAIWKKEVWSDGTTTWVHPSGG